MNEGQNTHNQLIEKARAYHIPQAAQDLLKAHPPLVIAGITASGKSAVVRYISETSGYRQVITHTTRRPRADEVDGHNYHFVSEEEMLRLIDSQAMIEVQAIHGDTVYGISLKAYQNVLSAGHNPLLTIDVKGVDKLTKYVPQLRPVFLIPPNFDKWMEMMERRGRMSHADRLRRMHSALAEIEEALENKHFFLVINQDIPQTAREILGGVHDQTGQLKARETAQMLVDRLRTI